MRKVSNFPWRNSIITMTRKRSTLCNTLECEWFFKADSQGVHLTHAGAAEVYVAAKIRKKSIFLHHTWMCQMQIMWMMLLSGKYLFLNTSQSYYSLKNRKRCSNCFFRKAKNFLKDQKTIFILNPFSKKCTYLLTASNLIALFIVLNSLILFYKIVYWVIKSY